MSAAPPWYGYPPVDPSAGGLVTSFNTRTGAVVPANGDYGTSAITNQSGVAGATDTAALNALLAAIAANTAAIAAIPISSERWAYPAAPHADDEEFTKTLAQLQAAGWNLYDGSGNTVAIADDTIDPYTNDAAAQHINGNTYRRSWLTLKIRNNNTRYYFLKAFTVAANQFFWARVGFRTVSVDDGCDIGLVVCAQQAGPKPDPGNRSEVIWVNTGAGRRLRANVATAGVQVQYHNGGPTGDTQAGSLGPYIGLQKIGTTYKAWQGGSETDHFPLTNIAPSGVQLSTMVYIGFVMQVADGTPGNGIAQADFVRLVNSSTFLF